MNRKDYENLGYVLDDNTSDEELDPDLEIVVVLDGKEVIEKVIDFDVAEGWVDTISVVEVDQPDLNTVPMYKSEKDGAEVKTWARNAYNRRHGEVMVVTAARFVRLQESKNNKFWKHVEKELEPNS